MPIVVSRELPKSRMQLRKNWRRVIPESYRASIYFDATKKELKGEVAGLFLGCGLACDNFVIFVFLCLKYMW